MADTRSPDNVHGTAGNRRLVYHPNVTLGVLFAFAVVLGTQVYNEGQDDEKLDQLIKVVDELKDQGNRQESNAVLAVRIAALKETVGGQRRWILNLTERLQEHVARGTVRSFFPSSTTPTIRVPGVSDSPRVFFPSDP